jgi:hypothetical protein
VTRLSSSLFFDRSIAPPMRRGQEQQDGRRIEQQGYNEDKPLHGLLVGAADERREVAHRAQVGLDRLPLAGVVGRLSNLTRW